MLRSAIDNLSERTKRLSALSLQAGFLQLLSIVLAALGILFLIWALGDFFASREATWWDPIGVVVGWLLAVVSVLFLVSGLDDLFIDIVYYSRHLLLPLLNKNHLRVRFTLEELRAKPEQPIALMIPCWRESAVIGAAIEHNIQILEYNNYEVFVGVYPNDQATIDVVNEASARFPNVHAVVAANPGPTNKADNLNNMYKGIQLREQQKGERFEIIIMHDAEDVIHPQALKLYNLLMPEADMVQIPIFPLEVDYMNFTHWMYNDEFAEYHTKDVVSRDIIGGIVPSAGVGTGFSRRGLEELSTLYEGHVFETNSLTEDYAVAVRMRKHNLRSIFIQQFVPRTQKRRRWGLFGEEVTRSYWEWIATRSFFPTTYRTAVRQRSRWILGIVFQEWRNIGWFGGPAVRYCLWRDRKAVFGNVVAVMGYIVFLYAVIYGIWYATSPETLVMPILLTRESWLNYILVANLLLLLGRSIQRFIATNKLYGPVPAMLSLLRTPYANVVNFHAMYLAFTQYLRGLAGKAPVTWDKTTNRFPTLGQVQPPTRRIGEILVSHGLITPEQLQTALETQKATPEKPLGEIMMEAGWITREQLVRALGIQFHIPYVELTDDLLSTRELSGLSLEDRDALYDAGIIPVWIRGERLLIILADPANAFILSGVVDILSEYQLQIGLADPDDIDRFIVVLKQRLADERLKDQAQPSTGVATPQSQPASDGGAPTDGD